MKKRFNILPERAPEERGGACGLGRFPSWLHRKLPEGGVLAETKNVLQGQRLPTVCEEAKCPNLLECWSKKTATFLVMGKECTRSCGFCDIDFAKTPPPLEKDEPERVAASVELLGLEHVVITQVARDDLSDGGAEHLFRIVSAIRARRPKVTIELLTSDFEGNSQALDVVVQARPDIFNHNIETVASLTPKVRHRATYRRSLKVLSYVLPYVRFVKSGLMLGLGEEEEEVKDALVDLKKAGVSIVTMGQYLQPNRKKLRVKSFVSPETFVKYKEMGHSLGIPYIYAGPFVRSSYNAKEVFEWTKTS